MAARSCPKCGSTRTRGDECLHCGIYTSKSLAYLARGGPAQVLPTASAAGHMAAVPFKVYGAEMQFVELELATGVAAVAEAGTGSAGATGSAGGALLGALFGGGTAAAGESSETGAGGEGASGDSAGGGRGGRRGGDSSTCSTEG